MDFVLSEVFESRRGNKCISINNFKFTKTWSTKNFDLYFRCTNKKCKAIAILNQQCTQVIRFINDHTYHNEYTTNEIKKEIIRSSVKRKAETELHIQPNKIIRRELQVYQDNYLQHSDIHLLRSFMYIARKKNIFRLYRKSMMRL